MEKLFVARDLIKDVQGVKKTFQNQSYQRHEEWYNHLFPTQAHKLDYYKRMKTANAENISGWLQHFFFSCLYPLMKETSQSWLTVGDAYGFDAHYLLTQDQKVTATDLNDEFLKVAHSLDMIHDYAAANAEQLFFNDNQFDYTLCKESYHHFPRPYAALYEMMRVSRKAVVIMEPNDPVLKMPLLMFLMNLFSNKYFTLSDKLWKNRFSYEPVGNFVYKVSEREFEKFAAGLNFPAVAFKMINPNFYHKDTEFLKPSFKVKEFRRIKAKKMFADLLMKLRIIPGQVLCSVIFKEQPTMDMRGRLEKSGFKIVDIPKNPFI